MLKNLRRIAIGKPYEGKLHVRFDEGALETYSLQRATRQRPTLYFRCRWEFEDFGIYI